MVANKTLAVKTRQSTTQEVIHLLCTDVISHIIDNYNNNKEQGRKKEKNKKYIYIQTVW